MLQEIIDQYLASDRGRKIDLEIPIHIDNPDEDRKFRMSDAGKCRLMRYWKRQGKEGLKPNANGLRVMEAGNLLHAWLNHVLEAMHVLALGEQELEDDHRIGHLDAIVQDGKHSILYDFKTISSKKAYYQAKNGWGVDDNHAYQLVTYSDALPISQVDEARIAYINRDTMEIVELPVDLFSFYQETVRKDWRILIEAWEAKQEPTANAEYWECNYCRYNESCDSRA